MSLLLLLASASAGGTSANAGNDAGTGAAGTPTVTVSAVAGLASGTGAAGTPTVSVSVTAGLAAGTGAAQTPTVSVSVTAGLAAGTGAAGNPIANTGSGTTVTPAAAAGTGAAGAPLVTAAAAAGLASGTGAAGAPATRIAPAAGNAAGTGTANNATVSTVQVVPWKTRLATATTSAAVWVAIGDSITEGTGSSTRTNRWIELLQTKFRSFAGVSGGGRGFVPCEYLAQSWATPEISLSGTNSESSLGGFGYRARSLGASGTVAWTVTGTSVDLWYRQVSGGGSFTWKVDSGSTTTVNTTAGSTSWVRTTFSLGTSGSHTVTVARTAGTVTIGGIMVYNGDSVAGVQMYDAAALGIKTDQYTGQSAFDAGTPEYALMMSALATVAPDMVTVMLGANDSLHFPPSAAQCGTNLTTIITDLQALPKPPHILLIAAYKLVGTTSWSSYVAQMASVATARGVTYLDLSALMPDADTSGTGFYENEGLHPNDSGQVEIARLAATALEIGGPAPTAAAGTGTANTPTVGVKATGGLATGTGAANAATLAAGPVAGLASGTGTAGAPTVNVNPAAGLAAGTGAATATTPNIGPRPGAAAGTGAANNATVSTAGGANPTAGNAAGGGTAQTPSVSVQVNAGVATGTGQAFGAAAPTGVFVTAGLASGVGAAGGPLVKIWVGTGLASGTGSALAPFAQTPGSAVIFAGIASGTGAAYSAVFFLQLRYPLRAGVHVDNTTRLHAGTPV